jgi:hypothetical protein
MECKSFYTESICYYLLYFVLDMALFVETPQNSKNYCKQPDLLLSKRSQIEKLKHLEVLLLSFFTFFLFLAESWKLHPVAGWWSHMRADRKDSCERERERKRRRGRGVWGWTTCVCIMEAIKAWKRFSLTWVLRGWAYQKCVSNSQ